MSVSPMQIVRAAAPDGRIFRAARGGYHVTRGAGDPEYYRHFNRAPNLDGGVRSAMSKPYKESVWVMAAINLVTQPIKAVGLKFYRGDVELSHPALTGFLNRPAVGLSYGEFIDATAGWWKLSGEFFWLLDDTWLSRSARKSPLIVARPDAMKPVKSGEEVIAWEWTANSRQRATLLPEQVIHCKRWNPYNPHRGLGELEAAILAASTDRAAGQFAHDTFANSGDQGDYIIAKNGMPSDPQREQIIASIRQQKLARSRGEFRPVLLSGDFEIKNPGITAPDAAFVANRVQNRHEVFAAFGVPLSMADVQASYSIGSASDWFRLIFGTCMPLGKTIAGAVSLVAARLAGAEVDAEFDWDEHPTVQAIRSERVDTAVKLANLGMPMREVNDYLDMGLPEFPGWDVGHLPFSVSPVGEAVPPPAPEPAPEIPPSEDPVALMVKALACPCSRGNVEKSPAWEAQWQARQPAIKLYSAKFNRELMKARSEVLAKLARAGTEKSVAADFLFDLIDWKAGLTVSMRKAGLSAIASAVTDLLLEVGQADDAWSMPPAEALSFLARRENFMSNIADDVHSEIESTIQQGLTDGSGIKEIAASVREKFNGISRERATTIAQTETAAAYGYSRDEAMRAVGIQWKKWLTSGNDNVRPTHLAAEGQTVSMDQPFYIGGSKLMYPGDGSLGAPAEEIINCHCVQIAVEKGAE